MRALGEDREALTEDILEAAHLTTRLIVKQTATRDVAKGVPKLVRQGSEGLKSELDAKIDALLASATQHPITYNAQLTENAQQI